MSLGFIHARTQSTVVGDIRDILLNRRDLLQASATPEWTSPAHAHVRGANYYQ
ncbi:MAG: hypothetical protein PHW66_09820 [Gallionella sp.]|nr:hypothetical protein [Gallionella sp.]